MCMSVKYKSCFYCKYLFGWTLNKYLQFRLRFCGSRLHHSSNMAFAFRTNGQLTFGHNYHVDHNYQYSKKYTKIRIKFLIRFFQNFTANLVLGEIGSNLPSFKVLIINPQLQNAFASNFLALCRIYFYVFSESIMSFKRWYKI